MQRHGDYLAFFNDSDILSHWYRCEFYYKGLLFNHMEKFIMCSKARLFGDLIMADRIMREDHPMACKQLGRQVANFDQPVWDGYNYQILTIGNREKYRQNPGLADFLVQTDPYILVEASPYDTRYGIGLAKDDARIADPRNHRGSNYCGHAQMAIREELKNGRPVRSF
ncbi:NADAR family protein [Paraburkholderia sp. BCC1886]|uniref:NADAR family protein n=1 Tax=Paraburkholderia sp. BCC1886 TaxID=2562670 RepID=UPI001182C982|nr:NADAR family protein [Paraburkholderia sp. BCC1886]